MNYSIESMTMSVVVISFKAVVLPAYNIFILQFIKVAKLKL